MRIILAVIVTAVAISVLIDSPRRELAAQLRANWQEYREHVGGPRVSATSKNLSEFSADQTGHKQENKRYYFHAERKGREAKQKQGAEQ